mmetsp:Transcript_147501/g.257880  ORF Transcript_147501/g.257880 Transcript_147501/m.257880 type:complete len:462 (+) Transcript_147501:858-2243(+)
MGNGLPALTAVETISVPALPHGVDGLPVDLQRARGANALCAALLAPWLAVLHEAGESATLSGHGGVALGTLETLRVPGTLDQVRLEDSPHDGLVTAGAAVLCSTGLVQQHVIHNGEGLTLQRLPTLPTIETLRVPGLAQGLAGGAVDRLVAAGARVGGALCLGGAAPKAGQGEVGGLVAHGGQGPIGQLDAAVRQHNAVVWQAHCPCGEEEAAILHQLRPVQEVVAAIRVRGSEGAVRAAQASIGELDGPIRELHSPVGAQEHPVRQLEAPVGELDSPGDLVLQHCCALRHAAAGEAWEGVRGQHVARGLGGAVGQDHRPIGHEHGPIGGQHAAIRLADPPVGQQDGAVRQPVLSVAVGPQERPVRADDPPVGKPCGAVGQEHGAVRAEDHSVGQPLRPVSHAGRPCGELGHPEARQVILRQDEVLGGNGPVPHLDPAIGVDQDAGGGGQAAGGQLHVPVG